MKKSLLLFVLLCIGNTVLAQHYEVRFTARLMYAGNDIRCNSHFKMTIITTKTSWEWYESVSANEDEWKTYSRAFISSADDPIVHISIYSMRKYERGVFNDCTQGGSGFAEFDFRQEVYACGSVTETAAFPGYDGQSSLNYTVKPLSGVSAANFESEFTPISGFSSLNYSVTFIYTDGTSDPMITFKTIDGAANSSIRIRGAFLFAKTKKVASVKIAFSGSHNYTRTIPVTDTGELDVLLDGNNNPFLNFALTGGMKVQCKLFNTNVTNSLNESSILPSENSLTLKADDKYHESFGWQYIIGASSDTGISDIQNSTWNDIPASLMSNSILTISGRSFFEALGLNYKNYYYKRVFFRAKYMSCSTASDRATEIVGLLHIPSAPEITFIQPVKETCKGSNDGKLIVNFNRPLEPNETISIFINGIGRQEDANIGSFDVNNRYTIDGRSPNFYQITLIGKYRGNEITYTGASTHKYAATIEETLAIGNFGAVETNVHCHAGEDGKITVSAQGGTSSYTAYLLQDGIQLTSISLTNTASSSFTDLKKGTYNVKLKDSNGCDPKDQNGNVIILQPVVNEPAKDIILAEIENIEPLGFGLKNGHVTVQAQEGTLAYTFSWVDKESGELLPSDAPIQQGPTMLNTLPNIGKGIYRVTVKDANYALAYPQVEKNISGCYDTMTFVVTEPPLLEVYLDEYHYVSCNGYNDGELVAHAKGGRPFLFGHEDHPYQYEWFILDENNSPSAFGDSDSIATERPSAWYRLRVTDRNGIQAWSPDYQLVQPDLLVVNFNTSELLCNGDNNAMSKALVAGGTTPYKYAWSTEETTSEISNLTEGWYSVVIKDIRGCTTYGQTQVKVPNSIEATAIVDNPTCEDYKDGSITLDVKGGVRPYAYEWNHGATSEDVFDLEEGSYNVKISDANNCFILRDFVLKDPELFALTLGPDRKLCRDQFLELDVALTDAGAQYNWTRNNNPFSNSSTVKLEEAGTYHVKITDSNGCSNEDEIVIQREDVVIDANIVVATRAPQGGKVRVANISHPASDNVEWIIPEEAIVLEETPGYVDLSFASKGEYSIGLTGFKGGCEKTVYSVVRIVDKNELTDYTTPDEPYIKQFIVKPNPNNGRFSVEVELREAADFKVLFHTAQGSIIREEQIRQQSTAIIEFNVASQVSRGVHLLQLITTQGYATFKIVIE